MRISIHAPLAGCDRNRAAQDHQDPISIHAPLAGCDVSPSVVYTSPARAFQSTHPLRGATGDTKLTVTPAKISIHAPLAGCDAWRRRSPSETAYFNPRTPCGVRRCSNRRCIGCAGYFNPRTPCGVRPVSAASGYRIRRISIHAPLAGCDYAAVVRQGSRHGFQSTHPLRGATIATSWMSRKNGFQSTHPLRGATAKTYKENCTFFELADKLSARIAAKKPSAKADRCA